jgi:hypothetical protein
MLLKDAIRVLKDAYSLRNRVAGWFRGSMSGVNYFFVNGIESPQCPF